jgi:signal transduction histidine kinase
VRDSRKPRYFDVEKETDLLWKGSLEFHRRRNHKVVFAAPLFAGDKILGVLCLALLDRNPFDEQKTEFIVALANQAALAVQLTKLADEARSEAEQAATLAERNRIAREIHDTLAQSFTGVILQLETARRVFGDSTPAKVADHVGRSIDLAREGLTEARRSMQALRPPADDEFELDLTGLLREKLTALTVDTEIETEFTTNGLPFRIAPETIINLLRVGQEAVTNALRHSGARAIKIALDYNRRGVSLLVTDDGAGFDVEAKGKNGGYGLRGMRERADGINADLKISSKSGAGTEVKISVGDCEE